MGNVEPPPTWEQIVVDLTNGSDHKRAVRAAKLFDDVANETHIPALYALMQHSDWWVREIAAHPLIRLEGVRALPVLLQALARGLQDGHDNDGFSDEVGVLLAQEAALAAPILLEMLRNGPAELRGHVVWGLGCSASAISADVLLPLMNDSDPEVRAEAAGAIGSFANDPRTFDALMRALSDQDEAVRIEAIAELGYLGDKRAIPHLERAYNGVSRNRRGLVEDALKRLRPGG